MGRRFRGVAAVLVPVALAVTACGQPAGPAGPPTSSVTTAPTTPASTTPAPAPSASSRAPTTPSPTPHHSTTAPLPRPTTGPAPFPSALAGLDVERIPTSRHVVALTFDAGANADGLAGILRTLAREHVAATFFVTGRWVEDDPSRVRRIAAAGHRIGNHTATHPELTTLGDSAVRAQVRSAERTILRAGADPRPLFRFPFGDRDARTIRLVNQLGYVAVRWTVDSLGWQGTSGGRSAATVTRRVLAAARPGEIVLLHVGSNPDDHSTLDADALPAIIAGLRGAGYGFVTLDALLTGGR